MITGPANYSVDHISVPACAALKIKLSSCWSIDCYDTNPGSQDTYYKVIRLPSPFDENELELQNVEFWQLKKLL